MRTAILSLLLLGTLAADQIRVDHREGTTGNFAPVNLTTLPGYVLTFDANGNPMIGAMSGGPGGVSDGDKGDVTVSASGATWTVDAGAISLAKLANLAQSKLIGRWTASTGVPEAITVGADFLLTAGTLSLAVAPQPADADLAYLAGFTPSANVKSLLNAADYAAIRTQLSLVPGTDVQAYDADLTDLAGLTAAQGDILIGNGTGDWTKLAKGTANQTLRMNAGATLPEWAAAASGSVATDTLWDAAGDLAVGSGADTAVKLTKGSALQVLRVNAGGTNLEWAAAAGGGDVTQAGNNAFTGTNTFAKAGAASTPAMSLTGLPFTGGDATTTKPLLLIEPTGTTSTGWSTLGTLLGVNAASGFAGNLIDLQRAGIFQFKVSAIGDVNTSGHITAASSVSAGTYFHFTSKGGIYGISDGVFRLATEAGTDFTSLRFGGTDLALGRIGVRNLRLGEVPSATPLAQTFTIGEASRPGTDSNVAGASGTIQSGLGTGTGTASSLIFQTPTVAGAGSGTQTYTTRMTVNSAGVEITAPLTASGGIVGNTGIIGFTSSDASAVATGKAKGFVVCPYAATISGWSIVVDAGTATVKCWKIASGTAKPTIANVINTAGVAISSGTAVISTTVTDFTSTAVTANDIFAFDITAVSGVTEITFQLKLTKS